MAVKPILFNTEMVRALLDGRKSVTRRVVKSPYYIDDEEASRVSGLAIHKGTRATDGMPYPGAPYLPGDILYVRETWAKISDLEGIDPYVGHPDGFLNRADWEDGSEFLRWRPSIHMPKEAARLFLRVTDVRVERLQDITSSDCEKEGVDLTDLENLGVGVINHEVYTQEFQALWDSTIKKADLPLYGWAASPWVWVIEFERCDRPKEEQS